MEKTRREFIQKLSSTLAGIPVLSQLKTTNPALAAHGINQDRKVLRVALLGLGSYADRVAKAMKDCQRATITGLVSGTPSKLKEWGEAYDVPEKSRYSYQNFDSISDNDDIDAVYVITPNGLHHEFTIRAARAGKHVICEKPMANSVKESQEMIEACNKAGVELLIGYRMHFEPKTVGVIKMRQDGEFGKIMFFQGQCGFRIGDPDQWRLDKALAGGGALMDIGIYAVNGARYMVGEEPIWVTAQETKTNPTKFKEGVDETITFQLGFPSGAVSSCLSTYNMKYLDRFYLNGTEGFAEMQPSTGYGPIEGRTHKGKLTQPHITHQTIQMDEMAAMIFDGKQPIQPLDGEEGLKDMIIIEAIYKAVSSGQKVELNL